MSEEWNGITLAEVRTAYFRNIGNTLFTVRRLLDIDADVDFTFNTSSNGAVVIKDSYLTWEFIAPDNYSVSPGNTVGDMFTNLELAVTANPVQAWEDFAGFLNNNGSMINSYLSEGASATITDAQGNTYPGTVHQMPSFNDFADVTAWMKTWMGSSVLAASSSVMMQSGSVVHFSLTSSDVTIQCNFEF